MAKAIETGRSLAVHLLVAFSVTWVMTGSLLAGGVTALFEALCNMAAHHYHRRLWSGIRGRLARQAA
ncbi:MAG: DUF2061 domain-containing protein [Chitinivorax sp.]